jgi:hypothetical protein
MADEEEMEINFRLDRDGRTALDCETNDCLDYASLAILADFDDSVYDDILFDCEISDSGLMPRTFWVPASSSISGSKLFQPRCTLEQFARDVFDYHTRNCKQGSYDPSKSGAEWWVQLRPSPETGRYSMHGKSSDQEEQNGICFHWDKDEDLRLLCGGTTYVHPHISTITYLTDIGAPTLIAEGFRVHNLTGEWIQPSEMDAAAFISWPSKGKHVSFDGRYLHAAPQNLQQPGELLKECRVFDQADKSMQRRNRRCTFLVNVWLNHVPFNVHPFPEPMIDKMSGFQLDGDSEMGNSKGTRLCFKVGDGVSTLICDLQVQSSRDIMELELFTWQLGDSESGEMVQTTLPVNMIRAQAKSGGNLIVRWEESLPRGIHLVKENCAKESPTKHRRVKR